MSRTSKAKTCEIDDKETFLHRRQKRIEKKLLKSYAAEIASIISRLVVENCNGCFIGHLSQTQHQCIMMERDEQLCLYFDEALSKISEANVMETFTKSLNDIKLKVNGLELLKYTCYDWRSVFCANQRRVLKQETLKLL